MSSVAQNFLSEMNGVELHPPIHTSSVLIHTSGWHTKKYFERYYTDATPQPLLLLANQKEAIIYISLFKEKMLARDAFHQYWKKRALLTERFTYFTALAEKITSNSERLTAAQIQVLSEQELIADLKISQDLVWELNALVFFSIYFDRQICEDLITELGISISKERFSEVWEHSIVPTGISFEKKRQLYLYSLIIKGLTWDQIAEHCQFFFTTYASVIEVAEVKQRLLSEYGGVSSQAAQKLVNDEYARNKEREEAFSTWLSGLSDNERAVAEFIQYVIELRDTRKDYLMRSTTIFHRIGCALLERAGLKDPQLVWFFKLSEFEQGILAVKQAVGVAERRKKGYSAFTHYSGELEEEYGSIEENKKTVTEYYMLQNTSTDGGSLKGQVGSRGKVTGKVKIIRDFHAEMSRFKKGEVLVTGMTRPEFVPLMKIASAIVTDEGGITCHAAIVSRELGIPCVIGTKIATKKLKDGDVVEVNADKGTITIL